MALLSSELNIDSNITLEHDNLNIEININDFKIKKVQMFNNYKMKLFLENKDGIKAWSYISAIDDSAQSRDILTKLLISPKIINIPLGVLPRLDIKIFEM